MKTTKQLLGMRIKELRKTKGFTQDKLSEKIGIDPKHLSRIEVGNSYPSLDTLDEIALYLDVEIKYFFEFDHFQDGSTTETSIEALLHDVPEAKRREVFKVVRALVL